jgi:hypothetical protein
VGQGKFKREKSKFDSFDVFLVNLQPAAILWVVVPLQSNRIGRDSHPQSSEIQEVKQELKIILLEFFGIIFVWPIVNGNLWSAPGVEATPLPDVAEDAGHRVSLTESLNGRKSFHFGTTLLSSI